MSPMVYVGLCDSLSRWMKQPIAERSLMNILRSYKSFNRIIFGITSVLKVTGKFVLGVWRIWLRLWLYLVLLSFLLRGRRNEDCCCFETPGSMVQKLIHRHECYMAFLQNITRLNKCESDQSVTKYVRWKQKILVYCSALLLLSCFPLFCEVPFTYLAFGTCLFPGPCNMHVHLEQLGFFTKTVSNRNPK